MDFNLPRTIFLVRKIAQSDFLASRVFPQRSKTCTITTVGRSRVIQR